MLYDIIDIMACHRPSKCHEAKITGVKEMRCHALPLSIFFLALGILQEHFWCQICVKVDTSTAMG